MRALILAAGEGQRLRPLTLRMPRPMVPVGRRPVLHYLIVLLRRHGIAEVAINLHYRPEAIVEYFEDGEAFGVTIAYSHEDGLLGSARAARALDVFLTDTFLCLYGDMLTDADVSALVAAVIVVGPVRETFQNVLPLPPDWDRRYLAASSITVPVMRVVFWVQGRYDLENSLVGPREYGQIAHAVGSGVFLAMGLSYFTSDRPLVSCSWLVLSWALAIVSVLMARFLTRRAVHWLHRHGLLHTRVVIAGPRRLGWRPLTSSGQPEARALTWWATLMSTCRSANRLRECPSSAVRSTTSMVWPQSGRRVHPGAAGIVSSAA